MISWWEDPMQIKSQQIGFRTKNTQIGWLLYKLTRRQNWGKCERHEGADFSGSLSFFFLSAVSLACLLLFFFFLVSRAAKILLVATLIRTFANHTPLNTPLTSTTSRDHTTDHSEGAPKHPWISILSSNCRNFSERDRSLCRLAPLRSTLILGFTIC